MAPSAPSASAATGQRPARPTLYVTLALLLLLLAVGAAGYEAATLLRFAITPAGAGANDTAADAAALVCDDLQTQRYSRLVALIDPQPLPPSITTTFNAGATAQRLAALDTSQGRVVACGYSPYPSGGVVTTPGMTSYKLTLRRANAAAPVAGALILRQSGTAGWLIERDSSFLITP